MTQASIDASMHRLALTFKDAALEARFSARRVGWIRARSNGFLMFVAGLALLGICVHWSGRWVAQPPVGVAVAEAAFPLWLGLTAAVHRSRLFDRWFSACTFVGLLAYVVIASAILLLGRAEQQAVAAALALLVTLLTCIYPTTLPVKGAITAVNLAAHLAAASLSGFMAKPQFVTMLLILFIGQTICVAVSYVLERMVRTNFFLKEQLTSEAAWSEQLLGSIFPPSVLKRLTAMGSLRDVAMVERHPAVSILFADLVGFTAWSAERTPEATVRMLDDIFSRFDALANQRGVEKIKTMGDAYLAATGIPDPDKDHGQKIADLALEMRESLKRYNLLNGTDLKIRIGIHTGEVVAGIIGKKKFHFDIWGDAVNTAARLESNGIPGEIVVSQEFRLLVGERYRFSDLGRLRLKGKGDVPAFVLDATTAARGDVHDGSGGLGAQSAA